MRAGSLFSGCGLADYGLHQAGFELAWACEIEKQPRAVLRRHFPKAEIHFDVKEMTGGTLEPVELLFFGSPCQDLSVAGKRAGLAGERSGLFAEAMRIVDEMDAPPRICVWENVCGALSSNKGADFATVLTEMGKRWSGVAYRVLDLQWFGVPQRRRRVFVVGHSGGWRSAAEVLFEREGLRRNPPTRRKAGQGVAGNVDARSHWSGGPHPALNQSAKNSGGVGCSNQELFSQQGAYLVPHIATTVGGGAPYSRTGNSRVESEVVVGALSCNTGPNGHDAGNFACNQAVDAGHVIPCAYTTKLHNTKSNQAGKFYEEYSPSLQHNSPAPAVFVTGDVAHCLRGEGFDASEDGTGRGTPIVPVACLDVAGTMKACAGKSGGWSNSADHAAAGYMIPVAFPARLSGTQCASAVRRLMPVECERLMGAPDGYTAWGIDDNGNRVEMADSPRYKMIGNGVGVPHSRWIGKRIVEQSK